MLQADSGAVQGAASTLQDAAQGLAGAGSVCLPAVDAGEHTGTITAMVGGLAEACVGLTLGLETGARAALDAGRQITTADDSAGAAFGAGSRAVAP